jgi:hypothetical protein
MPLRRAGTGYAAGFAWICLFILHTAWRTGSPAPPALGKLRFQLFTATGARPQSTDWRRCGSSQGAQCQRFVVIVDIELRPGLHHREIAQRAGQILIPQLALNSGGDEHVASMRHLQ